jgi:ATP-dependent Clp protease adaptor protein ClpS
MTTQSASVVEEAPPGAEVQRREKPAEQKPKILPPYAVVLHNDDLHSFPYVIETLMKVFGYAQEKCYVLTLAVHNAGHGIVWSGPKEVAELKRDQIRAAGPDFYAEKKVDFPLGVTIEPLPG